MILLEILKWVLIIAAVLVGIAICVFLTVIMTIALGSSLNIDLDDQDILLNSQSNPYEPNY